MKPMLASTLESFDDLKGMFPVIASPKIDGVRCLTLDQGNGKRISTAVSRNLLPIRNTHVREMIEQSCVPGLDGELVAVGVGGKFESFNVTQSLVSREWNEPNFLYLVFDFCWTWNDLRWVNRGIKTRYEERLKSLQTLKLPTFCQVLEHKLCYDQVDLESYYNQCLGVGHEGICVRTRHSPYKFGRSTDKECWLMKVKEFCDSDATVTGFVELFHNLNPHKVGHHNHNIRRRCKEGMVPGNTLGALKVKDISTGVEFEIGSGFNNTERAKLWEERESLIGKTLKYKSQKYGVKNKPRIPIFLGWRDDL